MNASKQSTGAHKYQEKCSLYKKCIIRSQYETQRISKKLLIKLVFFLPINLSAWGLLIFTNSCWRNCKRFCFEVSAISHLISSKSTEDGWCFVSKGMGGITSVLRENLTVTFLLQKKIDGIIWLCIVVLERRIWIDILTYSGASDTNLNWNCA
jgi:hypothetical protein